MQERIAQPHDVAAATAARPALCRLAPAAREARIVELLGKAASDFRRATRELDELVANLEGQKPTTAVRLPSGPALHQQVRVRPRQPAGRRVDGTAPGIEKIFDVAFSQAEAGRRRRRSALRDGPRERRDPQVSSPTTPEGDGSINMWRRAKTWCLPRRRAFDEATGRLDFTFDDAYLTALEEIPYPVPFRLLGDEARGYPDTRASPHRPRVSRGNKGTTFILSR